MSLKNKLTGLLYSVLLAAAKAYPAARSKSSKSLLLIKTDEIGDYILFRNFIAVITGHERHRNIPVTFVGNKAWKSLYDHFDHGAFENVLWLDKKRFKRDLKYRFQFLKSVRAGNYTEVVNCIYSRGIDTDDAIVSVAAASRKTGIVSDFSNRSQAEIKYDTRLYSRLIDTGSTQLFDLYRNRKFLSHWLGMEEQFIPATVTAKVTPKPDSRENKYYIVFSSAGKADKKWKPEYFAAVIDHISRQYGIKAIICGSPAEAADTEAIIACLGIDALYENYTGKTSLIETMQLLKTAIFTLSVDTGSVHLAAAVNCPVIGLFSGRHYGRFAPYPKEVFNKFFVIYPDHVDQYIKDANPILLQPMTLPNQAIQLIAPEKVIGYIDNLLPQFL